MRARIISGVIAGLMAGVVFGVMMSMMKAPTPDGMKVPMMAMVAMVVRSQSLVVGWIYHLFNSALIGGLFGAWLGGNTGTSLSRGLIIGSVYGIAWWVIGALILMPILLGMPAFAPLRMEPMRPVAMGSLLGHIMFGLILGLGYAWLQRRGTTPAAIQRVPAR